MSMRLRSCGEPSCRSWPTSLCCIAGATSYSGAIKERSSWGAVGRTTRRFPLDNDWDIHESGLKLGLHSETTPWRVVEDEPVDCRARTVRFPVEPVNAERASVTDGC